jgi:hypothetical protein
MNPSQLPLFAPSALGPEGLQYWPEFISAADEQYLIARIAEVDLKPFQFGPYQGSGGWLRSAEAVRFSKPPLLFPPGSLP